MSSELIARLATESVFRPHQGFIELAHDHVPFDSLSGRATFESKALRESVEREGVVGVIGPRGGGKSSLIANVCQSLPETHVALRVPVTGADDPTSVNVIAAVALSHALNDIELDKQQRQAIEAARADGRTAARTPGGIRGGTLGGGSVPAAVHAELGSLRIDQQTNSIAVERLAGLDRLISILVARGRRPVFVLEDTEAAIGGEDLAIAEGFLAGPVHALVHEVDAACLIAIQDVFEQTAAFKHLAASMALIEIPELDETHLRPALISIIEKRLERGEIHGVGAEQVLDAEALGLLADFYGQTQRNLRASLAALQSAAEYADETSAPIIAAGQMRAALESWGERMAG
jgi:Cdc6-like AAA superfamily ATPase